MPRERTGEKLHRRESAPEEEEELVVKCRSWLDNIVLQVSSANTWF